MKNPWGVSHCMPDKPNKPVGLEMVMMSDRPKYKIGLALVMVWMINPIGELDLYTILLNAW